MIVKDHNGKEFPTVAIMCRWHNIDPNIYYGRLRLHWSQEKALTTPKGKRTHYHERLIEIDGQQFYNLYDAAKYIGIPESRLQARLKKNLTGDLLKYQGKLNNVSSKDHLGKQYDSLTDMCKAWNISYWAVVNRINNGWSVKKALTTPVKNNGLTGKKKKCQKDVGK